MVELLRCQDRWGRRIVLDTDQWNDHIIPRHSQLTEQVDAIRATIESADFVTRDRDDPDRDQFYRQGILAPPLHRTYLKVCVDFGREPAYIVTAFPVKHVHAKELIRWP